MFTGKPFRGGVNEIENSIGINVKVHHSMQQQDLNLHLTLDCFNEFCVKSSSVHPDWRQFKHPENEFGSFYLHELALRSARSSHQNTNMRIPRVHFLR